MKKLVLGILAAAFALPAGADVTKQDILTLSKAGVSDDVIVSYVRKNGPIAKLSVEDVVELKKAKVSDPVMKVLLEPDVAKEVKAAPKKRTITRYTSDPALNYPRYPYYGARSYTTYLGPTPLTYVPYRYSHCNTFYSGHSASYRYETGHHYGYGSRHCR